MRNFVVVLLSLIMFSGCGRVVFLKNGYLFEIVKKNEIKSERAGFIIDGIYLEGTVITTSTSEDFVTLVQNDQLLRIQITDENRQFLVYHDVK